MTFAEARRFFLSYTFAFLTVVALRVYDVRSGSWGTVGIVGVVACCGVWIVERLIAASVRGVVVREEQE